MTAAAEKTSDSRVDALRWTTCFAVVAAAHGFGAMALLNNPHAAPDFGVDVPVVMIDLPESLATSAAPASALPQGPMEDQETDPTPPKEEIKPPEPEAEVAIPIPEPPKPEQVFEEKHMTAPSGANAPQVSVARWQNRIMAHIERFKRRYPDKAHGDLGSAKVSFTIDHEGRLLSSRIVQSSGSAILDDEALGILARAQPLPRPPDETPDADLTVIFQMNFVTRHAR